LLLLIADVALTGRCLVISILILMMTVFFVMPLVVLTKRCSSYWWAVRCIWGSFILSWVMT
jgi:hypothetical protein